MGKDKDFDNEIRLINEELRVVEAELCKWKKRQRDLLERKTKLNSDKELENSIRLGSIDWDRESFEWSGELMATLQNVFQIESFRPKQLNAINATLSGHHVLVVMPTGAGKSLCYQLPALVKEGITIVISPLVSLMEDQVRALQKKNIPAKHITSTSSKEELSAAMNDLTDKRSLVKLLYVTPERLAKSKRFMAKLQKSFAEGRLQRIAVDEVHCCSQWGHDFRPDYKFLGVLSSMFPKIPILGLTATATSHILTDVQKMLNISGCVIIKSTFNRPNLFYHVVEKPAAQEECLNILEKLLKYRYKNQSGIIYANSIKDCEDITEGLRKKGLRLACYHASLEADRRSNIHIKWHDQYYQAIVATVAFGMGIDKPNVRFVIHHSISKSMENYYQESGRAGRDGERAECITLYRLQDVFRVSTMVFSTAGSLEHLYGMIKFCLEGTACRRSIIAEHFNEDWGDLDCNSMCDICSEPTSIVRELSIQTYCKDLCKIISNAAQQDVKLTAQKLSDAWFMKGPVNLRLTKGNEPKISRQLGEDIIAFLLLEGYLREDFHFTAYTTISYLKLGVNASLVEDSSQNLQMRVRRYRNFEIETSAPSKIDITEKLKSNEPSSSKRQKRKVNDEAIVNVKKKFASVQYNPISNDIVCVD